MEVVPWSVPGGSGPVGGRWSPTGKDSHKEHDEESGERQGGKGDKAFLLRAASLGPNTEDAVARARTFAALWPPAPAIPNLRRSVPVVDKHACRAAAAPDFWRFSLFFWICCIFFFVL